MTLEQLTISEGRMSASHDVPFVPMHISMRIPPGPYVDLSHEFAGQRFVSLEELVTAYKKNLN